MPVLFTRTRHNALPRRRRFLKKRPLPKTQTLPFWGRRQWVLGIFVLIIGVLLCRAVYLQLINANFLQSQGNARHLRTLSIAAHRGMLMDRNGEPLAISTPVASVWVNPAQFVTARQKWAMLTKLLDIKTSELEALLAKRMQREFVYIKRHISPSLASKVQALKLPGVFLRREYRRYYPAGEVSAHVLGFTNVDDHGQEGLELALNNFLMGMPGAKRVIQDKTGQVIALVESLRIPRPGQNIRLSIDRRLQYLAYRELKAAVLRSRARAGAAIILEVHTGEVLAMVNQPAYNPNNRRELQSERYRSRAVTDVFEPGSTIKPFTIAAALESGKYSPTSRVNTHPGFLQLGKYTVRDSRNYGVISLATVIKKSSNVGASKIALSLKPKRVWQTLMQVGLGRISGSGFPGEVAGHLPHFSEWHTARRASISFGYGVSVTLLQLARAYAALGNDGILPPVHFLPVNDEKTGKGQGKRVMQAKTARQVLHMLKAVVKPGGTGSLAQISRFSVAGKTGTVRKVVAGKYSDNDYLALFAGIVPASAPRLVMVVLIDQPRADSYYGGKVAAPVFAKVMSGALRLLNIPPDNLTGL
jgi:cell division protein FtsI (penicillin-binding protein 3)